MENYFAIDTNIYENEELEPIFIMAKNKPNEENDKK